MGAFVRWSVPKGMRLYIEEMTIMAERKGPESGTGRPSPGQMKPNPSSQPRPTGKDDLGRRVQN